MRSEFRVLQGIVGVVERELVEALGVPDDMDDSRYEDVRYPVEVRECAKYKWPNSSYTLR